MRSAGNRKSFFKEHKLVLQGGQLLSAKRTETAQQQLTTRRAPHRQLTGGGGATSLHTEQ